MERSAKAAPKGAAAQDPEFGAGGILTRNGSNGLEVAVVHRNRHDGDWTLPKGHVEPGESWHDAAVREVREETGVPARTTGFAGPIHHFVDGRPKVVVYWVMEAIGSSDFKPSEEVKEVRWMTVSKALKRLDYHTERGLLERTLSSQVGRPAGPRRSPFERFQPLDRLASAIQAYGPQLDTRISIWRRQALEGDDWIDAASHHLRDAESAAAAGRLQAGWESLNAAKRMEIFGIATIDELQGRNAVLATEAKQKLDGWRKAAIDVLTSGPICPPEPPATTEPPKKNARPLLGRLRAGDGGNPSQGPDAPDGPEIREARRRLHLAKAIMDEHNDNQYFKLELFLDQVKLQLVLLTVFVILISILLVYRADALTNRLITAEDSFVVLAAVLFGMLGASVSALQSLVQRGRGGPIPGQMASRWITLTRPFIGAASALVTLLLFGAGVVALGQPGIAALYAIAFFSGFSERFVTGLLESTLAK